MLSEETKNRIKLNLIFLIPLVILFGVLVFFKLSQEKKIADNSSATNPSASEETTTPNQEATTQNNSSSTSQAAGSCGMLDNSLCSSAQFAVSQGKKTSGVRIAVPLDTKIYAPYDGVMISGEMVAQNGEKIGEFIAFAPGVEEWAPNISNAVRILASGFNIAPGVNSGDKVTKGEIVGTVKSILSVLPARDDNPTNLLVVPDKELTAQTPEDYLKALID